MKKHIMFCILFILFTMIFSINAKAEADNASTINAGISLDGNFNDWVGKPEITDLKHDSKSPQDALVDMKYIADNNYLYLYVKRLSGSKSAPWHFSVIITNASSGQNEYIDLFNKGDKTYVPVFDVTTTFDKGSALVDVSYNDQSIETTLSGSNDGKEIEFRIPLDKVGLNGFNQEVQFAIQSDPDKFGTIDWIPNDYPITITTGPTGWQFTSILFFIGVSCVAFMVYKRS